MTTKSTAPIKKDTAGENWCGERRLSLLIPKTLLITVTRKGKAVCCEKGGHEGVTLPMLSITLKIQSRPHE